MIDPEFYKYIIGLLVASNIWTGFRYTKTYSDFKWAFKGWIKCQKERTGYAERVKNVKNGGSP